MTMTPGQSRALELLCTVGLPALSDFLPTREPARDTPPPPQRVIDLDDAAAALLAMEEELGLGR
jgi:hypothetical protein